MSVRSRFVVFGALPATVLAVAAGAAFTFGQDVSQLNGTQEQTDYLVVATNDTSTANAWHQKAYVGGAPGLTGSLQDLTVATKYGELAQWFQVDSGAAGVPSAVQEPGDLAFINGASSTTSPADTNNGVTAGGTGNFDVVQAVHVKANITNVAALRQAYGTCLIPIRLWSTTDRGVTFADVTQTYLDTQNRLADGTNGQTPSTANPPGSGTDPYYLDCTTGQVEFTVPTDAGADHQTAGTLAYELTVERGGVFATSNNNTGAQPEFVFQATPIAYDPTNEFNTPGEGGNGQYTPNLRSDARKATVTVTASSPSAINDGATYPAITFATSPTPVTWTTTPTCGIYAASDTGFATALSGTSTAGTYVTHCSGGASSTFTPAYVNGTLIVKGVVTVTAASPSISPGATYPTITFTTDPSPVTWTTAPTCGIYATTDPGFDTPLTGASTAGTYVTHCTGGTSANYTPTHVNGSLTVAEMMSLSVHIATASTTVAMPLHGTVTNISVNWGDGSAVDGPFNTEGDKPHVYTTPGDYTISITGTKLQTYGHAYTPVTGAETITAVTSWGNLGLEKLDGAFVCATSLTSVPSTLPATVTSLNDTFDGANHFNQDISGWDTSLVTNMAYTFSQYSTCPDNGPMIFNQDISGWNTSSVTTMSGMLSRNAAFNQPIGSWNTANVTSMTVMFLGATAFNQDLSGWNIAKVTSFYYMFYGATAFNQDLSGWNTANVTNFNYMFYGATAFNQNLGGWNIGKASYMNEMLRGSGLSSANYSSTLVGWQGQTHQSNVALGANGLTYLASASAAHAGLEADGWHIYDAGLAP